MHTALNIAAGVDAGHGSFRREGKGRAVALHRRQQQPGVIERRIFGIDLAAHPSDSGLIRVAGARQDRKAIAQVFAVADQGVGHCLALLRIRKGGAAGGGDDGDVVDLGQGLEPFGLAAFS